MNSVHHLPSENQLYNLQPDNQKPCFQIANYHFAITNYQSLPFVSVLSVLSVLSVVKQKTSFSPITNSKFLILN